MERMWRVATNQIEIYSKFSLKTFFRHNVCKLFNFVVSFVYYKWQLRHFTVQINQMKRIHHLRRWNDKEREKTGNYSEWIYTNWFCVHSNQPRVMFMLRNSTWFPIENSKFGLIFRLCMYIFGLEKCIALLFWAIQMAPGQMNWIVW